MTKHRVTIVDYGIGNILSVMRAVEHVGGEAQLTSTAADVLAADYLIIPGVGAFAKGMAGLRERELVEPIREYAASGRPLLGICLGMQMLVSTSDEFGQHDGLDVIPGRVVPIVGDDGGKPLKVPHIGWNRLLVPADGNQWLGTPLGCLPPDPEAYFVHSYTVVTDDPRHRLAEALYGSCRVTAAIRRGNVTGCQFHPEKSGEVGLQVLRTFIGGATVPEDRSTSSC